MTQIIKKFLEETRNSQSESRDCWIFVVGRHNSGKTDLLKSFYQFAPENYQIEPSDSTFGYESSIIQYQLDTYVHIIEVTETCADNQVLISLLRQHSEKSAILLLLNSQELCNVTQDIKELLIPLFETPISDFDRKLPTDYAKFLTTFFSSEPMALADDVLTMNAGIPIFFVASHIDHLQTLDDVKFDSMMKYIREPALQFGAGIGLVNSLSLLPVIISCTLRIPLPNELIDEIGNRSNYFLPPGWDSPAKISNIQTIPISKNDTEAPESEIKKSQSWQAFLNQLQNEKRDVNFTSSKVSKTNLPVEESSNEPETEDFLSQFE